MKKLSLAIAAVLVGTLLCGTTVFAAGSSTTTTTNRPAAETETAHTYANVSVASGGVVIDGVASDVTVTVAPVSTADVNKAEVQAKSMVGDTAKVLQMVNVTLPSGTNFSKVQLTFNVSGVVAGQNNITVLHQKHDGTWEVITPDAVGNGTVTATFTSLSPVVIVTSNASPKTADVAPVAMIMVLVCLAGVAVCGKKVYNN